MFAGAVMYVCLSEQRLRRRNEFLELTTKCSICQDRETNCLKPCCLQQNRVSHFAKSVLEEGRWGCINYT